MSLRVQPIRERFFEYIRFFRQYSKYQNMKGAIKLTNKELLYIEDALGHEKYFKEKCQECSAQLSDGELKNLVTDLTQKHGEIFSGFYQLL